MKSDAYQFVVWGHKNDLDSYSHIQEAFFRTLQYMGRKVRWINEDDGGDFEKTIFISHGPRSSNIPIRPDAFYIIHNLAGTAAQEQLKNSNVLIFGVKTDQSRIPDQEPRTTEMYWASDQTPDEIQRNKVGARVLNLDSRVFNWVGSVWGGPQGNHDEIHEFMRQCHVNGTEFNVHKNVSVEGNVRLIRDSRFAPAIVGKWQRDVGFVPCRIFKNISYGQFGVTNSKRVNDFFDGRLVLTDVQNLFTEGHKRLTSISIDQLYDLMDYVAKEHTYVNRIETLLTKAEGLL